MLQNSPSGPGPDPIEQPGPFAELEIQVGPAKTWGTAKGRIPPDQTHYFIMTFGIWGSVATGIAGTVLTLRIGPRLTGLAVAELMLALAAALLIAACGTARERAGERPPAKRQ